VAHAAPSAARIAAAPRRVPLILRLFRRIFFT
jgi:hypothetical protein